MCETVYSCFFMILNRGVRGGDIGSYVPCSTCNHGVGPNRVTGFHALALRLFVCSCKSSRTTFPSTNPPLPFPFGFTPSLPMSCPEMV
jgi:hypothetical protein